MKINKEFSPTTIKIEDQEELSFFKEVFRKAYDSSRPFYKPFGYESEDAFQQKIKYVLRGLE